MTAPAGTSHSAPSAGGSLQQVLQRIYREDLTGILELQLAGEARRFYFVDGALRLLDGHPLAKRLAGLMEAVRSAEAVEAERPEGIREARQDLRGLVSRIASFLSQLDGGEVRFNGGADGLPERLVGPLPTGLLLMELAVQGLEEAELLERLGGPNSRLSATRDRAGREQDEWLDLEEAFLLSRLDVPMELGAFLTQVGLDRSSVLRALERLRAVGLVAVAKGPRGPQGTALPPKLVTPEVVSRFKERIAAALQDRPLNLDFAAHRERLRELLTTLGERDFYQLLEIGRGAQLEEVHAAYDRLAKEVHPSHGRRLDLPEGGKALELIFERATEAYLTLSDPKRRAHYDNRMGFSILDEEEDEDLEQRNRELAREYFQLARRMVEGQQYHAAHELLRDAARRDPRPEYFGLLAQVQAKNPNWLGHAVESYREAVRLAPTSAELHLGLALTCEQAGQAADAREQFERVLKLMPGHPAAVAGLERLGGEEAPAAVSGEGGGFLRRLLSRLFRRG